MTAMTSRERIDAAFRHEEPDRTPCFEYVLLSPIADYVLGRPYAVDESHWPDALRELGWGRAVRRMAIDRVELAERLEHDLIYAWPNPGPPPPHPLPRVDSDPPPLPPVPDDPIARVAASNAARAASPAAPHEDSVLVFAYMHEEMQRRGLDLPVLAPAYTHGIWTNTDLMQTMLMAPDVAHRHFELCTRATLAQTDCYARLGATLIGVGGDFAGNRPLISPASYREHIVPEVARCARHIHELGLRAVNASDGDLWPVIDDFLIGCEVDAYLEIDKFAGMELAPLKERYGNRITLFGNMDCGNLLSFGSVEDVRRATRQCLEDGRGDGGHIFCASNAITASVPLRNYMAMVAEYRAFFGLPSIHLD